MRYARHARVYALAALALVAAERAHAIDWKAANAFDVIEILTRDADGTPRVTKVWIETLGGRGYVRTNDSRWFENLVRQPEIAIRFGETEAPVRAVVIADPALRARVDARFAEKYPLSMAVAGFFGRNGGKNCVELSAR